MQLTPFIYFYGRCEEALKFYTTVFGGAYEVLMRNGNASPEHFAPDFQSKVSAARFSSGDMTLMASDGAGPKEIAADDGNISLSVSMPNGPAGERVFNALSVGGYVKVPYASVPWGGHLGVVHDRFATEWIITTG